MNDVERLHEVFSAARRLSGGERERWLDAECRGDDELRDEVRELLAADESDCSLLDVPVDERRVRLGAIELPAVLGEHRVLRCLGAGAMGAVYEAVHLPTTRRVALKVLKPTFGEGSVRRRLEQEGALLRRLHHPAIARVFDSGEIDIGFGPSPFLEMELIEGVPLDEHCARHELMPAEVLELIAQISEGVAYAHGHGVVHRDLKPANILVDGEGRAHIVDFGIARADDAITGAVTSMHTRTGQLLGTLQYMSPEQARGQRADVGPRSDLYALGVITYTLCTGRLPYRVDGLPLAEALARIERVDPSTVRHDTPFGHELDLVLQRALEKSPDDRYPSVDAWLDDVQRVRRGAPILARAPSFAVQLRKVARRHPGLARGVAVGGTLLTVGLIAATIAWWDANTQRRRADAALVVERSLRTELEDSLADGESMLAFLSESWSSFEAIEGEREVTARDVLDRAALALADGNVQPHIAVRLHATLAASYDNIGHRGEATDHWEAALALVDHAELEHGVILRAKAAQTFLEQGNIVRSAEIVGELEALAAWDHVPVEWHEYVERIAVQVKAARGDLAGAEKRADEAIGAARALRVEEARRMLARGQIEDTIELIEELRAEAGAELTDDHRDVMALDNELAIALSAAGRYKQAEQMLRTRRAVLEQRYGATHPFTLQALTNHCDLLNTLGRSAEVAVLLDAVLADGVDRLGARSSTFASLLLNRGLAALSLDKYDEADGFLTRALATYRTAFGDTHELTLRTLGNIATLRMLQGRDRDALVMLNETLAASEVQGYGLEELYTLATLANAHARLGDADAALHASGAARELAEKLLGQPHPRAAAISFVHAQILEAVGRDREAYDAYRGALEHELPASDRVTLLALCGVGRSLTQIGEVEAGTRLLHGFIDEVEGDYPDFVAEARMGLARVALENGDFEAAVTALHAGVRGRVYALGPGHVATLRALREWRTALLALDRLDEADAITAQAAAHLELSVDDPLFAPAVETEAP